MYVLKGSLYQAVSSDAQIGDRSLIINGVRLHSLVEHLLSCLFEFTTAVGIANLLGGSSRSTIRVVVNWGGAGVLSVGGLLVHHHALGTHGVLLRCRVGHETLVATLSLHAGLLADDVEHRILEGLLVLAEAVLLPGVVEDGAVEVVPLHAVLKEGETGAVVGLLLELEGSAVLHVLAEFGGVAAAQLFKRCLNLLLLDVVVLFVLRATR